MSAAATPKQRKRAHLAAAAVVLVSALGLFRGAVGVVDPQLYLCEPGRCVWPDKAPATQPGLAHLDVLLTLDYPIRAGYLEVTLPAGITFAEPPVFRITTSTRELLQDELPAYYSPPFANVADSTSSSSSSSPKKATSPLPTTVIKLPIHTKLPQDWELHFTLNSAVLPQQCFDHTQLRYDVYTVEGDLVDTSADRALGVFLHNVPYLLHCLPEPPEDSDTTTNPEKRIANMPRDEFTSLNSLGIARQLSLTEEDETSFLTHDERQAELERQRQYQLEQLERQRQKEELALLQQQQEEVLEEQIARQLLAEFQETKSEEGGQTKATLRGEAGESQEDQHQFDAWRIEEHDH